MNNFFRALKEKTDWRTLVFYSSWSLTLTSGISYVLGLLRDRIFARMFGLSRVLDIYNASFVIPDLLQSLFIGTALSAAFTPIFMMLYDKDKKLGYAYANQVLTLGVALIAGIGLISALMLPYVAHYLVPGFEGKDLEQYILLTRVMMLSPILFAISMTYGRILISVREFFWWGISPALYNLGIILGAVFLYPALGMMGLVLGTLFGIVIHLVVRLVPLRKKKYKFRTGIDFRWTPEMRETVLLTLPKMLQYGMWSVMLVSFTRIASGLPEGNVALYNYARNFQSLPVSLLGISIATAMYPTLSHEAGKGNYQKFKADFRRDLFRCTFYTTLAAIALAVLSKPLISVLLEGGQFDPESSRMLSLLLAVYCISVPLESLLHMYHRAYYSLLHTLIPSLMHAFTILLIIISATVLSKTFGIFAIPISFAAGMGLHIAVLATVFPVLMRKREAGA